MNTDPLTCSLPESARPARRDMLRDVLAGATVTATDRQVRWSLADPARFASLADGVEAERRCCPELHFTLTVDAHTVSLTVAGPAGTRDAISGWLPGVPGAPSSVRGRRTFRAGLASVAAGLGVLLCCVLPGAAAAAAVASVPLLLLDVVGGGAVAVGIGLMVYGAWTRYGRGRVCGDVTGPEACVSRVRRR